MDDDEDEIAQYIVADLRGIKSIAESLASQYMKSEKDTCGFRDFSEEDRLKLKHKIVKIYWDPEGVEDIRLVVCRTFKKSQPGMHDRFPCRRGARNFFIVKANEFISTFSLGVLQKSIELEMQDTSFEDSINVAPRFVPPLSSIVELSDTILKDEMANYNKLFLQFEHEFWDTDVRYILSAATGSSFPRGKVFHGDFAPVWGNLNFEVYPGSNILLLIVTGERAKEFAALTKDEMLLQVLPQLSLMYTENIYEKYKRTQLIPSDVLDINTALWTNDPLYYGAWAAKTIFNFPSDDERLSQPYGNLFITGEHTCTRHRSYMHGALFAGDLTVRKLLNERHNMNLDTSSLCTTSVFDLENPRNRSLRRVMMNKTSEMRS